MTSQTRRARAGGIIDGATTLYGYVQMGVCFLSPSRRRARPAKSVFGANDMIFVWKLNEELNFKCTYVLTVSFTVLPKSHRDYPCS